MAFLPVEVNDRSAGWVLSNELGIASTQTPPAGNLCWRALKSRG